MSVLSPEDFIRRHTVLAVPPLVPEISLHLAQAVIPLWEAMERFLGRPNPPPPYWAFAWPGGQALARFVLDHPEHVSARHVVDFAAGCGIGAIAAAHAGADGIVATDIDPLAQAAIRLNGEANGRHHLAVTGDDATGRDEPVADVILAGDVCYEKPMAGKVLDWLRRQAAQGVTVLLADPGRAYAPRESLDLLASYDVPVSQDVESTGIRTTRVWKLR
ncbi:MAG: 50S ribosomal protein L11 methyltransferase [Pseudomonadota bacterium]|nr:50S ribosomal protein L11 methyltransferase [Pseudomonadota bacterium]